MKLDEYDMEKLEKARKLVKEVYEYNFDGSNASKKLLTVLNKIERILDEQKKTNNPV